MEYINAHLTEIIIGFVAAVIGNALASGVQNKVEGKNPEPCAKSGAIGGLALGVVAILAIIVQGVLS
jgi:xanthine/uracil permease